MKILLFFLATSFFINNTDLLALSATSTPGTLLSDLQSKPRKHKKSSSKSSKPQSKLKSSKGKPHKDPAYR